MGSLKPVGHVISVNGMYATGGSALRDAFRDMNSTAVFPTEFRLCKETFGLFNLRQELGRSRSAENKDLALRNFEWLTTKLAASGRLRFLQRPGHFYDQFTDGVFSVASKRFINRLTAYEYPMDWHFYDWLKPNYKFWIDSFRKEILGKSTAQKARMTFLSEEEFIMIAQDYLGEIFDGARRHCSVPQSSPLVLHNLVSAPSIREMNLTSDLIPGVKFVVVDRDPRDVFLDFPPGRYLPSASPRQKAEAFVDHYRYLREEVKDVQERDDVLIISFESLVSSPVKTLSQVLDFAGLPRSCLRNAPGPNFLPDISRQGTRLWERTTDEGVLEAVRIISQELEMSDSPPQSHEPTWVL